MSLMASKALEAFRESCVWCHCGVIYHVVPLLSYGENQALQPLSEVAMVFAVLCIWRIFRSLSAIIAFFLSFSLAFCLFLWFDESNYCWVLNGRLAVLLLLSRLRELLISAEAAHWWSLAWSRWGFFWFCFSGSSMGGVLARVREILDVAGSMLAKEMMVLFKRKMRGSSRSARFVDIHWRWDSCDACKKKKMNFRFQTLRSFTWHRWI